MCGRFSLTKQEADIEERFDATFYRDELVKRYNVAPSETVAVITNEHPDRIELYRWGLIPSWSKDGKMKFNTINAKAETLLESRLYKPPFKKRRCLIPADGFYEWKKAKKGKIPYRICLKDEGLFAFAGLFEHWKSKDGKQVINSCTIITTEPNKIAGAIHNRMPAMLREKCEHIWLDEDAEEKDLLKCLQPYPASNMKAYSISKLVNYAGNEREDILDEVEYTMEGEPV